MAVTSVILDIKANTDRALNDFKRFSSQLDNKFLISGLKLDVVRSALGQINREFQKAIGEQGLQAGQSLRAAQNQAALLTQTFKGFSSAASLDMAEQFSTAFNEIAVKAGGTAQDVQKALSATPFISTNLSDNMRKALGEGVLRFQRDFRRAGLSEDFGNIARQFLMGQLSAREMIDSGDAAQSFLGAQLMRSSGGNIDMITNAQQRSEAFYAALEDPEFQKRLSDMSKRAFGFRSIIEDLSATLFNPERGVFGSLRQVTMSVGNKTTIFDETEKLVESVFGRQGLFVNFFKQIGKIFGIEDPLKVIIIGVRFITKQFDALNDFIQSPEFQGMVKKIQDAFNAVKNFATSLYGQVVQDLGNPDTVIGRVKQIGISVVGFFGGIFDAVKTGDWDPDNVVDSVRKIGANVRGFIESVGSSIREADVDKEGQFFLEIFKTVIGEVAQTLGTAIKEAILTVFSSKGLAVLGGAVTVLYESLTKFFQGLFGGNQAAGAVFGTAALAGIGVMFIRRLRTILASVLGPMEAERRRVLGGRGGFGGIVNRLLGGGSQVEQSDRQRRGSMSVFERAVLRYLREIQRCVCSPSLRGGPDIDVNGPDRRGGGRGRVSSLGYAGPRRPPAYSSPIGPLPDVRASYLASRRESARNFLGRSSSRRSMDLYMESLRGPFPEVDDAERGLMASRNAEGYGQRVADRYNRRFGRRARFMRGMRGFGKGALIAGGIAAGVSLLGGGSANAAEVGEEVPQVGAGQAFGAVGMGAAEGALTGAMFGPWGAAIGGVIGGGIALMDKGVRDAIGKFLSSTGSNLLRVAGDLTEGLKKNVLGAFEGIKSFASSIDWKTVLINALIPGGQFTLQGIQNIGQFVSKLDPLKAIETGINSIVNPIKSLWDTISGWQLPWSKRESGGPVIKGTSYIVGERGPEIFTPGQNGSISANRELRSFSSSSGSSVSANFNIAINVNGNMGAGDVESLRAPVLRIIEEAWTTATQGTVSRGAIA